MKIPREERRATVIKRNIAVYSYVLSTRWLFLRGVSARAGVCVCTCVFDARYSRGRSHVYTPSANEHAEDVG